MLQASGYSLCDYGDMILDKVRMPAYAEALRKHVKPGMVVADLGAGTGVFSLLACRLGAARVYAIEPDASILVARESAAANGYADRMICIEDMSTAVTLPEQVDLVVSDMRRSLPMLGFHLPAIKDARARLLKPGGIQIPRKDVMRCAPVEVPLTYRKLELPWESNDYDLNLDAARKYIVRGWWKARIEVEQMLAEAVDWATLNYETIAHANVDGDMAWTIQRSGVLHGLGLWFDAELCDGVAYSNAPGLPETVYGHSFAPLPAPVAVAEGDRMRVRLRADMVRDDYVYRWDTTVTDAQGVVKADFQQSAVGSAPVSKDELSKRIDTHVPKLGEKGQIDRFVLEAMAGSQSLHAIAQALSERFPQRFADWRRALDVVAELSVKYSA